MNLDHEQILMSSHIPWQTTLANSLPPRKPSWAHCKPEQKPKDCLLPSSYS